ncbi:MAG TPA: non-homologous end-joining DNA ligase [Ktedonobacteraceae bacterium]|nr:non-homologous end-joining DNA ligase [Ktedonobacteraceae bacterium]
MNTSAETWQLGNQVVQVSHLEKVYWPQSGFTKGELLDYYRQIAPVLLPHLKDRPVTLRVYPQGVEGTSYYLRDCPADAPEWLQRVQYQPKTVSHPVPLPLIDTAAGLLWFANQGAIEFHLWSSRTPDLSQPDLAIFDLDAGSAASFDVIREAALRLHDTLEQAGISGYPKTSGEGGLHIFVPLRPGYSFERVRGWAKAVGQQLASNYPNLIASAQGATHKGGRVSVDYAQNSLGRNTAAPYTLRAHPVHPTVSTPLTWEELGAGVIHPTSLSPQVVLERVSLMGDLFVPVLQADQHIE